MLGWILTTEMVLNFAWVCNNMNYCVYLRIILLVKSENFIRLNCMYFINIIFMLLRNYRTPKAVTHWSCSTSKLQNEWLCSWPGGMIKIPKVTGSRSCLVIRTLSYRNLSVEDQNTLSYKILSKNKSTVWIHWDS